jgi:hypothetical protein
MLIAGFGLVGIGDAAAAQCADPRHGLNPPSLEGSLKGEGKAVLQGAALCSSGERTEASDIDCK